MAGRAPSNWATFNFLALRRQLKIHFAFIKKAGLDHMHFIAPRSVEYATSAKLDLSRLQVK